MKLMTVKELIEKLKKFNPDGNAEICTHYMESEEGYNDIIDHISMEEGVGGKMLIILHTCDEDY